MQFFQLFHKILLKYWELLHERSIETELSWLQKKGCSKTGMLNNVRLFINKQFLILSTLKDITLNIDEVKLQFGMTW